MSALTVIIITKNEELKIRRCLESVKWADEIIVLDSGSTDNTVTICKEFTDHVFITDWPGYGPQKNRALNKARSTWVLSLDADEVLSQELSATIKNIIKTDTKTTAFSIPIQLIFMGRKIKYANGSSKHVRLFRRADCQFQDSMVHEDIIIDGTTERLTQPIYHHSFSSIHHLLSKMNNYTDLVAEQRLEKGKKSSLFKAFTHALWMFIKVYFIKRGFLDGGPGFVLAVSFAEGSFYRYAKMVYHQQEKKSC